MAVRHTTKNIIQYGWQRRRRASAPPPPPLPPPSAIKPLATERTRGDAIYSDWAFEICMPHTARLPQRLLCFFFFFFSEDVTATGTWHKKKTKKQAIDTFPQLTCCDIDTVWPDDNNVPHHPLCVVCFTGRGWRRKSYCKEADGYK